MRSWGKRKQQSPPQPFINSLRDALRNTGGMSRTLIGRRFTDQTSEKITTALAGLEKRGEARCEIETWQGRRGRPVEFWVPVD
jgi:hypothetical protein